MKEKFPSIDHTTQEITTLAYTPPTTRTKNHPPLLPGPANQIQDQRKNKEYDEIILRENQ